MDNEERVVRLAKPLEKGPLRLVFSRFCVIALLLVFQIAILVSAYGYFTDKLPILINLLWLFSLCHGHLSVQLPYGLLGQADMDVHHRHPAAARGVSALYASRISATGWRQAGRAADREDRQELLDQPENVLERLERDGSGTDDLCRYLNRSGRFPLYDHTAATFFPSGEAKFKAMLEELEKAEKFIFLEYFIIEEGYMWGRILDVLTRKAKEGVEVRVMYDGMCELGKLPSGYWKLLNRGGHQGKALLALSSPLSPPTTTTATTARSL